MGIAIWKFWQISMRLVVAIFQITQRLPDHQRFTLTPQMQRAAISIPSNIAEGHVKRAGKDYLRHVRIAAGSLAELETQIELCVRLNMLSKAEIASAWGDAQRVGRMLTRLAQRLARSPALPKAQRPASNPD